MMIEPITLLSPTKEALEQHLQCFPGLQLFPEALDTGNEVFDQAMRVLLRHEGYYSEDADDEGGATKYGISLRAAQDIGDLDGDGHLDIDLDFDGDVDSNDIKLLTLSLATDIYKQAYWSDAYEVFKPCIAIKNFDMAVNMGSVQSHKLLQRSVRACTGTMLVEDGIVGPKTIEAVNLCDDLQLLSAMRSHAAGFYRLIANNRPRSRKYLKGWLKRAYF